MSSLFRLLAAAAITLSLSLGMVFARSQEDERDRMKSRPETIVTGCLTKGDTTNQYVLTDANTNTKLAVTGVPDLEQHASNHTVKLTGTMAADGKSFSAAKVDSIAPTCDAGS